MAKRLRCGLIACAASNLDAGTAKTLLPLFSVATTSGIRSHHGEGAVVCFRQRSNKLGKSCTSPEGRGYVGVSSVLTSTAYGAVRGGAFVPSGYKTRVPREANKEKYTMSPNLNQPVTDDSIKVRQLSHYQFSWVAGEPGQPGSWTLQLVLDQGAWEEVLTIDADDADNLQDLLSTAETVYYDVQRRTLMFGTTSAGHH